MTWSMQTAEQNTLSEKMAGTFFTAIVADEIQPCIRK